MAQNSFDQLSKQYLEEFLTPIGTVQRQYEIPGEANLSMFDPRRSGILRLLASWKVRIDLGGIEDFSGREAIMALSEAFLEWEQATQQRA